MHRSPIVVFTAFLVRTKDAAWLSTEDIATFLRNSCIGFSENERLAPEQAL
jgi:hypothetical protein